MDAGTATMWTSAITGATTLAAGLGGAALANRHAERQRDKDLMEARRLDQRDAAAELIDSGLSWVRMSTALIYGIAHLDDPTKVDMTDLAKANERFSRALSVAVLTITEKELRPYVRSLSQSFRTDDSVVPVVKARFAGQPVEDVRDKALAYTKKMEHEIKELVTAALRVLTGIEPVQRNDA